MGLFRGCRRASDLGCDATLRTVGFAYDSLVIIVVYLSLSKIFQTKKNNTNNSKPIILCVMMELSNNMQ